MTNEKVINHPAYLIDRAPKGWLSAVIKNNATNWQADSGVSVAESKFTLLLPIHNEERFLNSSVGALLLSNLPTDLNLNVLFYLNGCTDRSKQILTNVLGSIETPKKRFLSVSEVEMYQDQGLKPEILELYQNKIRYLVCESSTLGKANAIQVGSRVAQQSGHDILISLDTNNLVEPKTLPRLYGEAHRRISLLHDAIIVSSVPIKVHERPLGFIENKLRNHGAFDGAIYTSVSGWCFAIGAKWAEANTQPVAVEDYALGLIARSAGQQVVVAPKALVWGYRTNLKDSLRQFRRSIRGRMQLLELHSELKEQMETDNFFMRPFPERLSIILESIVTNPNQLPNQIWKLIFTELGIFLGRMDYKKDPTNQSWDSLQSSKASS